VAVYLSKNTNSMIINEEEFDVNTNIMPEVAGALGELNPDKTIYLGVDLPKTPFVFLLYFRALLTEEPFPDIKFYFRDDHELLPKIAESYNMDFNRFKDFPYPLNTSGEKLESN